MTLPNILGTCSGEFGYIIAVINVIDIGKGMVLVGSGQAEFITRYRAIVYKPFKGEVVDAVVNNVNKVCMLKSTQSEGCPGGRSSAEISLVDGLLRRRGAVVGLCLTSGTHMQ